MKNALNNQVGMLGDMFLWLVANLKQGGIYFIKQAFGNDILASVYASNEMSLITLICVTNIYIFTKSRWDPGLAGLTYVGVPATFWRRAW